MSASGEKKRKTPPQSAAGSEDSLDEDAVLLKVRLSELANENKQLLANAALLKANAPKLASKVELVRRIGELREANEQLRKANDTMAAAQVKLVDEIAKSTKPRVVEPEPQRPHFVFGAEQIARHQEQQQQQQQRRCNQCGAPMSGQTQASNWDAHLGRHVTTMVDHCGRCERGSLKMF